MRFQDSGSTLGYAPSQHALPVVVRLDEALLSLPALTVLGHPDITRIGELVFLGELVRGREALLSRFEPHFSAPRSHRGEPLADPFLSRRPLRIEPLEDGGVRLHRDDSQTRVSVEGRTVREGITLSASALEEGVVLELAERIVLLFHCRREPGPVVTERFGLVGESAEIEAVRQQIARVAPLPIPVLLRGETGTGKEIVARALHERSPRAGGPFLSVNLAALPTSLAAAELFGARKGAYTGAVQDQPGFFGRADGGTLFLDEIGEAPLEIQAMLLRALETGEIVPVGGQTVRRVDVRIVGATDADLETAIRNGSFRAPLLHRLMGYTIRLPPLRRRREDVGRLLVYCLGKEMAQLGEDRPTFAFSAAEPWLPASLVARLARYSWPGNVRQLQNVVRQLVIDGQGQPILRASEALEELLSEPEVASPPSAAVAPPTPDTEASVSVPAPRRRRKPSEVSEAELQEALRAQGWNLKATAEALGIARTSLYILLAQSPRARAAADVPPEEIRRIHERCGGDLEAMVKELQVSARALRQRLKDLGLRLAP